MIYLCFHINYRIKDLKEQFNPYTSSMSIFSLFYFQYHSFPSAAAILTGFTKKVVPPGKSSSRYERIKNKQVAVLLSIQKARKRYTLIL